jgi:uncharacterized membrane protein
MLAPRPTKLRSQRDINLWRIPLQLSLAAVALFGITLIPDILDKYGDAAILHQAETGTIVSCAKSGYLQHVDHGALVAAARAADALIVLRFRPGQFVLRGEPLASAWFGLCIAGIIQTWEFMGQVRKWTSGVHHTASLGVQ